ncbi:MAG: DNA-processing protein DprA [Gammaproteobacteria bacterium]
MDIEAVRCALALHSTLHLRPRALAHALEVLASPEGIRGGRERFTEFFAARLGTRADWDAAEKALRWQDPTRQILVRSQGDYPANLAAVESAPPILFSWGTQSSLQHHRVGVVGSRAATCAGREFARELARDLVLAGFCVVSGLARGIDAAAHRGALDGGGVTLAVLGCGIDSVYPKRHLKVAEEIACSGAILSELPLGARPLKHHFPLRNRIISGLSSGIVVVEATLSSGSLITARTALEQGREVFAVPGSPRNPFSQGCHALLKDGAHLVESASDVFFALPPHARPVTNSASLPVAAAQPQGATALERKVLDALGFEPAHTDALLARTGLTMTTLSSILLRLELSGAVRTLTGGRFERTSPRGASLGR